MVRLCIFSRHAESTAMTAHTLNGDPRHAAPLTSRGRWQARRLGDQLRHQPIDLVVCTRHSRTRGTADLAIGSREVEVVEAPAFDEIRFGTLEGHEVDDYAEWFRAHGTSKAFPHGESYDQALGRYADGLRWLAGLRREIVLVICHRLPLRCILDAAGGGDDLDPTHRSVAPATPYLLNDAALASATATLSRLADRPGDIARAARGRRDHLFRAKQPSG